MQDNEGAEQIDQVMTEDVITCDPEDDVERAEALMSVNQLSRLVCVDETGQVAGVISLADIAQYEDETRAGEVIADVTARETVSLALTEMRQRNLTDSGRPERVRAIAVTPELFDALAVRPALGRAFQESDVTGVTLSKEQLRYSEQRADR